MPDSEANFLINAKAAVPVDRYVQAAAVNSIVTPSATPVVEKPIIESKVVIPTIPEDNTSSIKTEVDVIDSDENSGDIDISNFKVIEELPLPVTEGPYQIPGIDSNAINVLVKAGYKTIDSLKGIKIDALIALPKIGYQKATKIAEFVKGF